MEKERFLVEVTVKGEKDWKAIHMCGSMADAVPDKCKTMYRSRMRYTTSPICSTRPSLSACARRGARVWRADGWKGAKITWQSILAR